MGRTFDLRKAYRQIGIRRDQLDLAWISVFDPHQKRARVFKMESMPFGATASVAAFLRISQAIKLIRTAGAALVWSSFYDDFVCICEPSAVKQTKRMIHLLFSSLGWELSTDADKNQDFSEAFNALGVRFNLATVDNGWFTISNTDARKDELRERIDAIFHADSLSPEMAASLRSRLLFMHRRPCVLLALLDLGLSQCNRFQLRSIPPWS